MHEDCGLVSFLAASPLFWVSTILVGAILIFSLSKSRSKPATIQVDTISGVDLTALRSSLIWAFEKYSKNGKLFKIAFPDQDTVIVPAKYIPEIGALPEKKASLYAEFAKMFLTQYTLLGVAVPLDNLTHLIRTDVARRMAECIAVMHDESSFAMAEKLGFSKDWTPFPAFLTTMDLIAQITARIFVGLPNCRNPEWVGEPLIPLILSALYRTLIDILQLHLFSSHTRSILNGAAALRKYPQWQRPFAAHIVKEMRDVYGARKRMRELITPIMEERLAKLSADPDAELPSDFISWTIKESRGEAWSPFIQTEYQLGVAFGAINTTSQLLTNVLFDICANPSCIEPLRAEWQSMLAATNGVISKPSLMQLPKMDSVIKESQRTHPNTLLTFSRYVTSDLALSDGTILPRGTSVATPLYAMNFDRSLFEDPERFDPMRFEKMRREAEIEAGGRKVQRWGLTHSDAEENMNFGFGIHACPGRWLAANELKMLLGKLLTDYDVQMENPAEGRPENILIEKALVPNPMKRVMFRRRK